MIKNKTFRKSIALFMLINLINQLFFPSVSLALNGGPNAPEFSSFEPVATTDMVNPFTGDFTYNLPVIKIPGPDGGGYPLSLSYHSGVSSEEEASWVGFGWTLNAGSINRSLRGFPDDYKNVPVKQYNKVMPNWSAGITMDGRLEKKSKDKKKKDAPADGAAKDDTTSTTLNLNLGLDHSLRYNNYQGFSASTGFDVKIAGYGSVGANVSGGGVTFSASVDVLNILNDLKKKDNTKDSSLEKEDKKTDEGSFIKRSLKATKEKNSKESFAKSVKGAARDKVSQHGTHSITNFSSNISVSKYQGVSYDWSSNLKVDLGKQNLGIEVGYSGNYNIQANDPVLDGLACGYMYNPNISALAAGNVLSDHYIEKGNPYNKRDHFLGMPFNNADSYFLSGEGLGGGFQLFHKKIGHFYSNFLTNEQKLKKLALEFTLGISAGNIVDAGIGFNFNVPGTGKHKVEVKDWLPPGNYTCEKTPADFQFDPNDTSFFRFNNDLGGSVVYSTNGNADAVSAEVSAPGISSLTLPSTGDTSDFRIFINSTLTALGIIDIPYIDLNGAEPAETIYFPCIKIPQIIPATKHFYAELGNMGISNITSTDYSVGGSSFIDYNVFPVDNNMRFEKDPGITAITQPYDNAMEDGVAELSVHNESGLRYVYGLPVYTRNEKNFQIGAEKDGTVENNYLYYSPASNPLNLKDPLENKTITGEERDKPYATTYLLTQITTPDYVNVVDPQEPATNGLGAEDFGGWTKFAYRNSAFTNNQLASEWYQYRTPYSGLMYQKNSISNQNDDIATVSTGEKQVYYMKAVETKTHVAFFITNKTQGAEFDNYVPTSIDPAIRANIISGLSGSQIDRLDGLGALRFDPITGLDAASLKGANANSNNNQKIEKLERIVLFAKSRFEKPVQTTHFEYNNSLVRNLPNSVEGNYPSNPDGIKDYNNSGKLTLKKVWFEYEGVVQAKISPYVFNYTYRTDYTTGAASGNKYEHLNEMSRYSVAEQNPDYQPESLDIWGNYQYQGAQRKANMKPWVSQEDRALINDGFDPAAWQLKQIILPSGGEINVQYEEGDYCFVQDRSAMAMVSLLAGSVDSHKPNETEYILNLKDIGLNNLTSAEKTLLVAQLKAHFGLLPEKDSNEREKVFFKFLYALKGNNPSLNNCKSEYITGYTEVNTIDVNASGDIYFSLGTKNGGKKNVPKWVAHSFLATQRNGLLNNSDCTGELENVNQELLDQYHNSVINSGIYEDTINKSNFRKNFVRPVLKQLTKKQFNYPSPGVKDVGTVNYPLSYLRIPLFTTDKKGGGIRVKRVLMYDNGINTGDVTVYGSQYTYTLEDGRSSGVAVNEPSSEENALKGFLPRLKQSFLSRAISGLDRKQAEGPLGESLLPGPSVSYSRITVQNIHGGKTGTGYKIEEYYTAKDFAFDRLYDDERTEIEGRGVEYTELKDNRKRDKLKLPLGLFNYSVDKLWLAQGFRFINTNMHGQIKKTANYGNSGQLSSYSEYEYFLPGEKVPMLTYDKNTQNYSISYTNPGKEEQITNYMNSFSDVNMNLFLSMDLVISFTATGASAAFGLFPSFNYSENEYNTHTTTKVLRYPAIQKSVINYQDGIVNKSENIAFNPHTGSPVLTKTADGFDKLRLEKQNGNIMSGSTAYQSGAYYNLLIPASWVYEGMGQKSKTSNSSSRTNQLNEVAGNINYYGHFPLLDLSNPSSIPPNPNGVISANAQTFDTDWFPSLGNESIDDEYGITSTEKLELNKKWHPKSSYVYRTDVSSSNGTNDRIYTGGIFSNFNMFDWISPPSASSNPWLVSAEITKYSPHGLPLEEKNVLDIYSSNKYGYGGTLVTVSAQNASYNTVQFEDFENVTAPIDTVKGIAHSGNASFIYNASPGYLFINPTQRIALNQQLKSKGASVKVWLKSAFTSPADVNLNNGFEAVVNNVLHKPFTKIAQTGEWTLYEAKLSQADLSSIPLNSILSLKLNYNIDNGEIIYMDDFRFQPLDAQAVCYVYDVASLKLLTQFDDQHFGLYYQYNDEGKLVRKQIETERGLKTIQETQYHTPLVSRNLP